MFEEEIKLLQVQGSLQMALTGTCKLFITMSNVPLKVGKMNGAERGGGEIMQWLSHIFFPHDGFNLGQHKAQDFMLV